MFWKKEVVYTDMLAEYRKVKIGDFYMFDEVIIEKTFNKYNNKGCSGIIVGGAKSNFDGTDMQYYDVIGKNGVKIAYVTHLKKCYGEFQEEFEALEEAQRIQLEVSEKQQRLKELLPKLDKIKDKNFTQLGL